MQTEVEHVEEPFVGVVAVLPVHHAAQAPRLDEIGFKPQGFFVVVRDEVGRVRVPEVWGFGIVIPEALVAVFIDEFENTSVFFCPFHHFNDIFLIF